MSAGDSTLATINSTESDIAEKRTNITTRNRALYARKSFKRGDIIATFGARRTLSTPTYLTVQISENEHIELFPDYLECINHSCDPNCLFDTTAGQLVALKAIEEGEEFGFFYPSAEWDMDQPFECKCGQEGCIGTIKGARYLSARVVKRYRFTDFIKNKLKMDRGITAESSFGASGA